MITKVFKLTLTTSMLFFLVVAVLALAGGLTFGTGLGDAVYAVTLALGAAILLFIQYIYRKLKNPGNILGELFGILLLLFIVFGTAYKVTLGRGPQYRWNGHIFTMYSAE